MKKVFIDTNVFIDYVARRAEFYTPAATIVGLAAKGHFCLLVSSLAFATADCIVTRNKSDFSKSTLEVYEPKEFLDMLLTQNPTT